METYDEIANLLEKLAGEHERVADLLKKRDDPKHLESNTTLADAETLHADACRRAAKALRDRSITPKTGEFPRS